MACGRKALAALAAAVALQACAMTEQPDDPALCSAYADGRSRVEVVADGTVTRTLGIQPGRVSPHEGFLMRLASACSVIVRVEVNTDFTGSIPLAPGQHVLVKGEYEYYPLGGIIHWTHRDPRGRHAGGYIATAGRIYD
ncbi:MAG TPA: DUF3465 domain-containing protein [Candidatus Cybelea sp.]|nr:DUF3465 domain-containing protein [Candidatus Cybelea sp.]